jgi:ectoine hydroxylase-related dioxygenase (phytanoyl-CoA dioxygenase family)
MDTAQGIRLSADQIETYHRDGYLIVDDLLTDAEVDDFVAYENEPKPKGWREDLLHHVDDERWASLARHPNVTGPVSQILDARPMIVQSMYMEKKPTREDASRGRGIALHQDLHYLPCEPEKLMACWMAMSDTDGENGGLCVVAGSHRQGIYQTHKTEDADEHDAWEVEYLMRDRDGKEWKQKMYSFEIEGLDRDQILELEVPKGGGVFFSGRTIHGSYANRSLDRVRRAFAVHYVPEGTWMYRADVQEVSGV